MAVSDLIDAIKAKLPTQLQSRIFLGSKFLAVQDRPPRIVFVWTGAKYGPPVTAGADPKQLWTRSLVFRVHCWGADEDDAEALAGQVEVAIHQMASPSYELHTGECPDEVANGGGNLSLKGFRYLFLATIDTPVTEEAYRTAVVTSIPETGVLVVGAPPTDSPG